MDGFKNSTRMKYMDEGVSTRPTTASGRRMTNEELGMTPGGVDPAKKKAMPKGMGAMSDLDKARAKKKAMPKVMSDLERARMMARPLARKEGSGVSAPTKGPMGPKPAPTKGKPDMYTPNIARNPTKLGGPQNTRGPSTAPAYSDRPMIRRSTGGLSAMPKGKC